MIEILVKELFESFEAEIKPETWPKIQESI
jgi:hypothetical protein